MSDAPASPKKTAKAKAKTSKPKTAPVHPPVAQMVIAAIKALKDRKGCSLAAIKKYIEANYKVELPRLAPFIRKFLKKAVADGKLVQTKGTGAAGSFKLPNKEKAEKPKAKPKTKPKTKKPAEKKAKKPAAKKSTKKPAAKKSTKSKKTKTTKPKKVKKPAAKKSAKKSTKKAAKK